MKIISNTDIGFSKWQEYVDNHELGTIFHTPFMFEVYSKTIGYQPFALFVLDDNGSIISMLLGYVQTVFPFGVLKLNKRIVLMNSPIYSSKDALDFLLTQFRQRYAKMGLYTEIRNHCDTSVANDIYIKHNFQYEEHLNILIDLSCDEDKLWTDMSSRRRKEVKHAEKENFTFRVVVKEDYGDFYQILSGIYNHAKIPLVDVSFFQAIWDSDDSNRVILGLYDQDVLVGAVLLFTYKQTIYSVYGGSRSEYYNRRPNDYMFWQIFLWAKQHGYKLYDWLGAGNPHKPYGVRDWKKQFGGTVVNHGRYQLTLSPLKFKIAEMGFRFVQNLKRYKRN